MKEIFLWSLLYDILGGLKEEWQTQLFNRLLYIERMICVGYFSLSMMSDIGKTT
jgi:hypothetical protein